MKKLFTFATALMASFSLMAQTTTDTDYSTRVISAEGTTSTWTFKQPSSNKNMTAEITDNDIVFIPSASNNIKVGSSALSWKGESSGYIPVPNGGAGTIKMTVTSASDSRYLQLYVNSESAGDTKRLFSRASDDGNFTSDGKRGPQTLTFTSDDLTTKDGKSYLHFKDNNTEMKIAAFEITLTIGSYTSSVECTEADATFTANATNLSIEAGQTETTTTLTFIKGLNTSDATFAVLKDGKATEDATVVDNVFTATAAGEYTVKATQEFDETYCQVVKEVVITVTDNRPTPVTIFSMVSTESTSTQSVNAGTVVTVPSDEVMVIGGTVLYKNNNTSAKDIRNKQSNVMYFMLEKTGSYFAPVLTDNVLEEGDMIIASVYGGKDNRGLFFTASEDNTTVTDYFVQTGTDKSSNTLVEELTYTIKAGDDLIGQSTFYIERYTGNSTYFHSLQVVRPADDGTAKLAVNTESVDLNVTAVETNPTATVRFSGKNLTPNTYDLVVPQVAGLTVTPSQVVVGEDGKLNAEVVLAYTSTVDVAAAVAELSLTIDDLNAKVAINYSAELAKEYATSLNIEQLVLDNGVGYDIKAALAAANIDYASIDALDSLNDEKDYRNYGYLGLKMKKTDSSIAFWLKQSSTLKVRFGYIDAAGTLTVSAGTEETLAADTYANATVEDENEYSYTATDDDTYVVFSWNSTKTLVFKQIMIDEDIATVVLPEEPGTGTSLDNTAATQKAHKVVRDGQLLIIRDGKTYTAQGVELK